MNFMFIQTYEGWLPTFRSGRKEYIWKYMKQHKFEYAEADLAHLKCEHCIFFLKEEMRMTDTILYTTLED